MTLKYFFFMFHKALGPKVSVACVLHFVCDFHGVCFGER